MQFSWKIKISIVVIVILILNLLVVWAITSPQPLPQVSQSELSNGLFGSSYSVVGYNISDDSGTFLFKFGLAYDRTIINNSATEVSVYCSLANQKITLFFTKGVALSLNSATLLIDDQPFAASQLTSKVESGLQVYSFGIRDISLSSGNHTLAVKLFFSTIDVNYIGNFAGSYQSVSLNGTFNIV